MADILPFRKPKAAKKPDTTLCRSGFHRWKVDKDKVFDVKQGRLVTAYRCERCGALKTEAR
ncbi:hypothetical protein SAMN02949497_0614 [Methylomagnum ishizawai]|uniref:Uncharacterized protein n=1 Tax=Methylomagnum ishizawai TaxID=1760988 RepID=A0A1Y6CSP3_9GAMM|nr:hypothetical protein [Methylomagnum ishizawai]SMF93336.1 hypothetical protein SAMN02949497_0614 [Methylomagnum ishizawai]